MKWFRDASIKTKLTYLFGVGCGLILLVGCATFVYLDFQLIRKHSVRQISVLADALGANSVTALRLDHPDVGNDVLSSLRLEPSVIGAATYDAAGNLFSVYQRSDTSSVLFDSPTFDEHQLSSNGYATLIRPIMDNQQPVGHIVLVTSTRALYRQLVDYAVIACVIFLVGMSAVAGISSVFQMVIVNPILELVDAMQQVSSVQDYDQRVEVAAKDEVGALCRGFNNMIDQIANRDTRLREAMQQVEEAQHKAEAANNSKSLFLANMSHEIRTPLTAILGFTELLLKGGVKDPSTQRKHLETVHTSGRRLLNLINNILDLSKIEADQMPVEKTECAPHAIIEEVVSLLRDRAMKKGIDLDYTWSGKVPAQVFTDSDRLRQLLMNVVSNAVKFTERGGVHIVARTDGPVEQAKLVIEVVDSGIGISFENLQKIFDPFVQADNSVTRQFGGTGLGLAISRRLARALGGELQVQSQPGQGTTFTISVDPGPLKDVEFLEESAAAALSARKSVETPDAIVTLPPYRILLVEDGPTNRKLFRAILEEAGAHVTTAENGQVGVELASENRFDLVLMDMQMPVMDGYSTVTRMRELGMDVPVIALTAYAMKGDEDKCTSAGCSGYLAKPIKSEHLLKTVAESLAGCETPTDKTPSKAQMSSATSPISTVDESMIVSTLPLGKSIVRDIVIEFSQFFCDQLGDMRKAYSAGHFEELAKLAHSLKGAGGSAGFDELTEPARHLQHWSEQEHSENIVVILTELSDLSIRIAHGVSTMQETDGATADKI